jgi:RNA polymerase sigma-70 factor (ECF subfamily)
LLYGKKAMLMSAEFNRLLKPIYNDVARYCRALCSRWSSYETEDVLQDALLLGMRKFDQLRDPEKFKPWLFQIVTRSFYSSVRSHFWKRFLPMTDNQEAERIPQIYDIESTSVERQVLGSALSHLSAKDRAAILLFEVAGFSVKEIADIQHERSISTVKSRLSRSRNKLKTLIRDFESSNEWGESTDIGKDTADLLSTMRVASGEGR